MNNTLKIVLIVLAVLLVQRFFWLAALWIGRIFGTGCLYGWAFSV